MGKKSQYVDITDCLRCSALDLKFASQKIFKRRLKFRSNIGFHLHVATNICMLRQTFACIDKHHIHKLLMM
ncbi:hypothetical protein OIU79_002146 [Salix purpurea]|uniref:Uncharacterized protein n=1 Tax=Salix purpurea TaxID=77065 RepID=A0A9Q0ZHU1_SALPP|nr:hypothetical protein OIU79_002146 [Salix purpurea]